MVIEYTLDACDCGLFDELILVVADEFIPMMQEVILKNGYTTPVRLVEGGKERVDSCRNAIMSVKDEDAYVVIHNGVQPFVTEETFSSVLDALHENDIVSVGIPSPYTVLLVDGEWAVVDMPDRSMCYLDLGPESFRLKTLRKVIGDEPGMRTNITGMAFNRGMKVSIVTGDIGDFKITTVADMIRAESILSERQEVRNGK